MKINQLPGGGPGLAVKTVEELLGVPINYYAQIDFEAFVKFIDDIDGLPVEITETMTLETIGNYNEQTFEPGSYTLPGKWALAYVRARKGSGDDFGRQQRQQEAIIAIRNQILEWDQMPKLIANAPTIYADLSSGVHTNLSLDQIIQFALLMRTGTPGQYQTGIYWHRHVEFGTSPDGLGYFDPDP